MIKKYKKTIVITSILIVLPMIVGLILWNRLPDQIATHFSFDGTPDDWSPKAFVVFGMPLLLLIVHGFCIFCISSDPKRRNISDKMFLLVLWIVPIVSLVVNLSCYGFAFELDMNMGKICLVFVGLVFIFIGNYLPKSRQSYTVGIKVPWTLESEENWNRTHRLAGWMWMGCGILILVNIFLMWQWLPLAVILAAAIIPVIYSFILYKKGI